MKREASSPLTVVLVQPHGDTLDLYCEYLRAQKVTCVPVTNVTDAIAVAPRADVLVTGLLLPGSEDGVELITRLRDDRPTARLPIVVLTACALESERRRAEAAGCDSFLLKPCLPSDLFKEIRRVTRAARLRRVRGAPIEAGHSDRHRRGTHRR
jgi:CheY-like chemotaxis protein